MENLDPQTVKQWIDILIKPTAGLIFFIVIILYREAVIEFIKTVLSWFKKNE